jgi:hypothetical protein
MLACNCNCLYVNASINYNANAAITYASSHCNSDVSLGLGTSGTSGCQYGWLCDGFVKQCLKTGGITINSSGVMNIYNEMVNNGYGSVHKITTYSSDQDSSGNIKVRYDSSIMSPGDVVFWRTVGSTNFSHTLLIGGNNGGYATIYAHNTRKNNETFWLTTSLEAYVVHINGVTGSDTEAPVISNIQITNITDSGYTVNCTITDDTELLGQVQFATWTVNNGQDDVVWYTYRDDISSNTWNVSYQVDINEHNNEQGGYLTVIYAWDKSGNLSKYEVSEVIIDNTSPVIGDISVTDITSEGYTVNCLITDNYKLLGQVQFATWTVDNGQDDVVWYTYRDDIDSNWWNVSYRVNISEHNGEYGEYKTVIYAWDKKGNLASKTTSGITVEKDTEPPIIGKISITDIDSTGYTVNCLASDNEKLLGQVQFATWTVDNGLDDVVWYTQNEQIDSNWQNICYRVNIDEHNNENGIYYTRMYVWDKAGNIKIKDAPNVMITNSDSYILGDINLDGVLNNIDATLVLKYLNNNQSLNDNQIMRADANFDKSVNILDVIKILNIQK